MRFSTVVFLAAAAVPSLAAAVFNPLSPGILRGPELPSSGLEARRAIGSVMDDNGNWRPIGKRSGPIAIGEVYQNGNWVPFSDAQRRDLEARVAPGYTWRISQRDDLEERGMPGFKCDDDGNCSPLKRDLIERGMPGFKCDDDGNCSPLKRDLIERGMPGFKCNDDGVCSPLKRDLEARRAIGSMPDGNGGWVPIHRRAGMEAIGSVLEDGHWVPFSQARDLEARFDRSNIVFRPEERDLEARFDRSNIVFRPAKRDLEARSPIKWVILQNTQ